MRILLIGASGQLGLELSEVLKGGEVIKVYNTKEVQGGYKLDLTSYSAVEDFIVKKRPDVIINTASLTDVDKCETEKGEAFKVNAEAVKHVVRASRVVEAYLIHISTDTYLTVKRGFIRKRTYQILSTITV